MKVRWILLLLLVGMSGAAQAEKPWFYPQTQGLSYVNPYLTPGRALKGSWAPRFEGQLVLWPGIARHVRGDEPQSLLLHTDAGDVKVQFSRTVKNLQTNRESAGVAIKGHLRRTRGGTVYLEGRSVIPWHPAQGFQPGKPLIEQWIAFQRPELSAATRQTIARAIEREAAKQHLDPLFLTALIQVESGFDPKAVSVSGAQGLGQLMPFTAAGMGVNALDVEDNIRGCAQMIGGLVHRYQNRADGNALALASYNAGPNLVARTQRVPPYEQTVNYVYFIGKLHSELHRRARDL